MEHDLDIKKIEDAINDIMQSDDFNYQSDTIVILK